MCFSCGKPPPSQLQIARQILLKTIINRFLYAKFPLGVRLSYIIYVKIKVGRTRRPTFVLEQVTRVELAGNSLGSCRHTARRHLHCSYIIYAFTKNVNRFFILFPILFQILSPFLSIKIPPFPQTAIKQGACAWKRSLQNQKKSTTKERKVF